jgi:hypothetical protein
MKRVTRWSLGSLVAATVLVAVAHLPPVAGWLGWSRHGGGSCPFGYGKPTVATARPQRVTPGPLALGFQLGTATRHDIEAWADANAVSCRDQRGELSCSDAPGALIGGIDAHTLWFAFAADDTLAQIRTVRPVDSASALSAEFKRATAVAEKVAGAPTQITGDADPAVLALGALRHASAEFDGDGFRAVVRATNLGAHGYVLTESYAI